MGLRDRSSSASHDWRSIRLAAFDTRPLGLCSGLIGTDHNLNLTRQHNLTPVSRCIFDLPREEITCHGRLFQATHFGISDARNDAITALPTAKCLTQSLRKALRRQTHTWSWLWSATTIEQQLKSCFGATEFESFLLRILIQNRYPHYAPMTIFKKAQNDSQPNIGDLRLNSDLLPTFHRQKNLWYLSTELARGHQEGFWFWSS